MVVHGVKNALQNSKTQKNEKESVHDCAYELRAIKIEEKAKEMCLLFDYTWEDLTPEFQNKTMEFMKSIMES